MITRKIHNLAYKIKLHSKIIKKNFKNLLTYMENYLKRLKTKLKIKKLDPDQPINAWLFVLILNIIGFAGYFYLKINDIHL